MNTKNTKDSHEVVEFMGLFAKLKDWCDNEPDCLTGLAKEDEGVRRLCDRLFWIAHRLKMNERRQRQLFAAPVDPKFITAWRDFEDHFRRVLADIWLADVFLGLVATEPKLTSEVDRLWEAANADAVSQSAVIESAIDYAQSHVDAEIVEGTYGETIEDGVAAWEQLKRDTGFDLRGVFRRRQLIPFVFLPRHVAAKHGSAEKHSMLKNLQQAHEAFVFGTPLACLAMMRSIVEAVLRDHYRAQGEDLKERIQHARNRLPREANEAALHRLRKSANAVLHLDRESGERLPNIEPIQLEKEIVSLLFVLRALIEGAPK